MSESTDDPIIRSVSDLAEHLGLSRWTVSRILNGHDGVRSVTKKRVLEEMERLNFHPNMMARGLRGAKTNLIGVCFQEIESPILARKISLLQGELRKSNLKGIMELTAGSIDAERDVIRHFLSLKVDGIILIGSQLEDSDPLLATLDQTETAVVTVDAARSSSLPGVALDRRQAMYLCLKHLMRRKRSRFALLGLENDRIYGVERIEGLRAAAIELGIDYDSSIRSLYLEDQMEWSYGYGYKLGQDLMRESDPPNGIIALNDRVAIGAMRAIREFGHSVPGDFSIVGFDNLDVGSWTDPPLTTISQNEKELIGLAVQMVRKMIFGETLPRTAKSVTPRLVLRSSA